MAHSWELKATEPDQSWPNHAEVSEEWKPAPKGPTEPKPFKAMVKKDVFKT